ncbi:MAG: hypothetical protein DWI02_06290 [Planctomycetota bacterium]|nr:MAG: hypothetical protein DWI02_06290 [Planctomycetota bacterium]
MRSGKDRQSLLALLPKHIKAGSRRKRTDHRSARVAIQKRDPDFPFPRFPFPLDLNGWTGQVDADVVVCCEYREFFSADMDDSLQTDACEHDCR